MQLAIATDHRGLKLKAALRDRLRAAGHDVLDLGSHDESPADYPDYAFAVARKVVAGEVERGILICGTGIGMSIAANKVQGARAALVQDVDAVRLSREHNDANILVLPGNRLEAGEAGDWVELWLATAFGGDRHARRIDKINDFDRQRDVAEGV
ncbi:MAG: ribose 5-phosphate isomerase B [bacterium]|nr:ribose 5-phosphate isomerase B [bacterium]